MCWASVDEHFSGTVACRTDNSSRPCPLPLTALVLVVSQFGAGSGCIYGDYWNRVTIKGQITNAETGEPLSDFAVSGAVFLDGRELDRTREFRFEGTDDYPFSGEPGQFGLEFSYAWIGSTQTPFGVDTWTDWPDGEAHRTTFPGPEIPPPDQFELTVVAGGCEHVFSIALGDAGAASDNRAPVIIELDQEILVELCAE